MFIRVEETPNPDTLKFIPEKEFEISNNILVTQAKLNDESPFAKEIFKITGVKELFITKNFVSVTKAKDQSWAVLKTILTSKIGVYLDSKKPIILKEQSTEKKISNPIEEKIIELLESRVKPVVEGHGGDISFHSYSKGIVNLELKGSCSGCPSSTATLKMGIENMLKHYIPEIKEVQDIGEQIKD
tara:strand:+ start:349 stop:906 length:558 start_codon:yes stop_codon:yes gene_type:complete